MTFAHGFGVENGDGGAFVDEGVDHIKSGCFADVVGVGFEGQAPECEMPPFETAVEILF